MRTDPLEYLPALDEFLAGAMMWRTPIRGAKMCLAIPGQVVELVDPDNHIAKVDVGGVKRNVNVGLLDETPEGVSLGDWVLIHVGFALSKVDEEEAAATLALLEGMGEAFEDELEQLKESNIS